VLAGIDPSGRSAGQRESPLASRRRAKPAVHCLASLFLPNGLTQGDGEIIFIAAVTCCESPLRGRESEKKERREGQV